MSKDLLPEHPTVTLKDHVSALILQHGGVRAAARATRMDPGYLSRLASGEKLNPTETMLRRLGLRRVISYYRRGNATT